MTKPKTLYQSEDVVMIGPGEGASPEMEAVGFNDAAIMRIRNFAEQILDNAMDQRLSPSEALNACLNAIVFIVQVDSTSAETHRALAAITEALFAAIGGDSDLGKHQVQNSN